MAMAMRPRDSEQVLRRRLAQAGLDIDSLLFVHALEQMLGFFCDERAIGVVSDEEDGDMLLYQWGTYDFAGRGSTFQLGITRQFIERSGDQEMSQLSVTLHYAADSESAALGSGSEWLQGGAAMAGPWRTKVRSSAPSRFAAGRSPSRVDLQWSPI
jgi:hypothetical protein